MIQTEYRSLISDRVQIAIPASTLLEEPIACGTLIPEYLPLEGAGLHSIPSPAFRRLPSDRTKPMLWHCPMLQIVFAGGTMAFWLY